MCMGWLKNRSFGVERGKWYAPTDKSFADVLMKTRLPHIYGKCPIHFWACWLTITQRLKFGVLPLAQSIFLSNSSILR